MLTISDLIAVLALCATFYSLGYMHGKHDSKTQNKGIQSFLGSLLFRVFRSGSSVGSFSRVWF